MRELYPDPDLDLALGMSDFDAFRRSLSDAYPDARTPRLSRYVRQQLIRLDNGTRLALANARISEDRQAWSDFTARARL